MNNRTLLGNNFEQLRAQVAMFPSLSLPATGRHLASTRGVSLVASAVLCGVVTYLRRPDGLGAAAAVVSSAAMVAGLAALGFGRSPR